MMTPAGAFAFLDPGPLVDGDLRLALTRCAPADAARGFVPSYWFTLKVGNNSVGILNLRIGWTREVELIEGHLGYTVYPPYRGRRYAERACRLLLPLARAHGLSPLWITCNPDNIASRRTCERLGATFVDVVRRTDVGEMSIDGEAEKCRYRLETRAAEIRTPESPKSPLRGIPKSESPKSESNPKSE